MSKPINLTNHSTPFLNPLAQLWVGQLQVVEAFLVEKVHACCFGTRRELQLVASMYDEVTLSEWLKSCEPPMTVDAGALFTRNICRGLTLESDALV